MISQKALSINGDSFSPLLLTCTLFLKLYSIIKVILFIDLFTCLFSHHLNVHSSEPCLNYFQQYPWDLEDCQAHWWVLKNHLLNRRIKRKELYLCMILSVTRSTYSGCWLFTGGSGGGVYPPSPLWHPYQGAGERETSSISHRSLHQSCIPHILSWWTVPAGTAEEHINNSTARAWPLRILSYSCEISPTPEFSQIYFTKTSDEHALFSSLGSFSGSNLTLLLAQTLPESLCVA